MHILISFILRTLIYCFTMSTQLIGTQSGNREYGRCQATWPLQSLLGAHNGRGLIIYL
jgi:hypothetical protein